MKNIGKLMFVISALFAAISVEVQAQGIPLNCLEGQFENSDGTACVDECPDGQIVQNTNQCAVPQNASECTQGGKIYLIPGETPDGNRCVTECPLDSVHGGSPQTECRLREASDCTGSGLRFLNPTTRRCVATCPDAFPADNGAQSECRPARDKTDCTRTGKTFWDPTSNECVATCPDSLPANDGDQSDCRPVRSAADCTQTGKPFRNPTSNECVAACPDSMPVNDGDQSDCRPVQSAADCPRTGKPFFDTTNNECVATCPDSMPEHDGLQSDCRPRKVSDCTDNGQLFNRVDGQCIGRCPDSLRLTDNGNECRQRTQADCTKVFNTLVVENERILNTETGMCDDVPHGTFGMCPNPEHFAYRLWSPVRNEYFSHCAEPLPSHDRHIIGCQFANWQVNNAVDRNGVVGEDCEIRWETAETETAGSTNAGASARGGIAVAQVGVGESGDSCMTRVPDGFDLDNVIRMDEAGVVTTVALQLCSDPGLFPRGLPIKPDNFDESRGDRLVVRSDETGNPNVFFGDTQVPLLSPTNTAGGGNNSDSDTASYVGFAGVAMFLAAVYWDGGLGGFGFTPEFHYAINESGYSANAGGRMEFQKENWNLYWTATQTNTDGDFGEFRYESGGEYKADFWTAKFSEAVRGEKTDYDFSLSANFGGGIWKINPQFVLDSEYEKGEWTTTNSFQVSGEIKYDHWNFSANTDTQRFQINAVRRF